MSLDELRAENVRLREQIKELLFRLYVLESRQEDKERRKRAASGVFREVGK